MLRNKNLIPLSHQHQRALALCVRIDRASSIATADLPRWVDEVALHFRSEIEIHFAAEEKVLFPVARRFQELSALVKDLLADHADLRELFLAAEGGKLSSDELRAFAKRLSAHIRREENELFEGLQKLLSGEELAVVGAQLNDALKDATAFCALPASRRPQP